MRRSAQQSARLLKPCTPYASPATAHHLKPSLASSATSSFTTFSSSVSHSTRSLHAAFSPQQPRSFHTAHSSIASLSSNQSPLSSGRLSTAHTRLVAPLHASFSTLSSPSPSATVPSRSFVTSRPLLGFEEFFLNQQPGRTGRMWRCSDLRLKSFDDLQKLWFVLLKERNMLLTYRHQCTVTASKMANPERLQKVKKSMAHIKMVLGERHREVRERTEEPDSEWRKRREEAREKRALIKQRANRQAALPRQVHRQKERHPKRKKIKFRELKPRTAEAEQQPQSQVATGEGAGQAQTAV